MTLKISMTRPSSSFPATRESSTIKLKGSSSNRCSREASCRLTSAQNGQPLTVTATGGAITIVNANVFSAPQATNPTLVHMIRADGLKTSKVELSIALPTKYTVDGDLGGDLRQLAGDTTVTFLSATGQVNLGQISGVVRRYRCLKHIKDGQS